MAVVRQGKLEQLLLNLLPVDGSNLANGQLLSRWVDAAKAEGETVTEADFTTVREALLVRGLVVKGKGRGGATGRASSAAPDAEDFELLTGQVEATASIGQAKTGATRKPKASAKPRTLADEAAQVISYRHTDKRKNNPEVGLVSEASDPQQPKKEWAYNPHLDPVLNFDSSRSELESQVADALASGDAATMKAALEEIQRRGAPYLQWAGKAERTSFEVDTVSLHVHERIDPMSILSAVRKGGGVDKKGKTLDETQRRQASLFEAPFENLPLRDAVDFYRHDKGWANRLVSGDSLQVMNSLLVKEGMAGQVQMVYIDPPYGIKYGSNFQPFVGKRDVKDRSDADLTQEPEMIKAFRDTWELGLHSYLSYLRDRLLVAKELLNESGSVFVQISDENLHHVREVLDEVFGAKNFVSIITVAKTSSATSELLAGVSDYVVWYARDVDVVKFRELYQTKEVGGAGAAQYSLIQLATGERRRISDLSSSTGSVANLGRVFRMDNMTSQRPPGDFPVDIMGRSLQPSNGYWKTGETGIKALTKAGRLGLIGNTLCYVRFIEDFPVYPYSNLWTDTVTSGFSDKKVYVVQTNVTIVERCMLMTTDPGDLVLDPTCGSGTTAFVAERWGRRWITCDTSRVAVTLAKQRLMTASFDYYELAYPHEGLKGGFIYKTVPHITLKSIANNVDIDSIYARLHPAIEEALAALNSAFAKHAPLDLLTVTDGVRKGQKLKLGAKGVALHEWEVPFPGDEGALPSGWPPALREPFDAFHTARQRMQAEMDRSIAANAENETLYDQPEKSRTKLRITGPFTVEAVPFPTVLSLEAAEGGASATPTEDQAYQTSIARSGESNRQQQWRDELLKTGIRGKGGQKLEFAELEVMAGTTCLHATGTLAETGERVVVSFGPEHGALEQRQVEHALTEAGELFPRPKMIVFCAFTFDPEAAKDIDALKGITALKAQMNTDLLTEDLKKARSSNQSFWLMGQPDVALTQTANGLWQVEVNGFDYFDTVKGELISGGKGKIAMWSLDTDYDGRSLFPHQVFFPMAGKDEGWKKLKKTIRAELDESMLDQFHGTVSLPFEAGKHGKAAVKIVDDRGIESLKILPLVTGAAA
ncbi:site-specific DNA-methyltransferase [Paucibacter sp. DJ2R-2]|uniref:site-specific DNA-methyltransferase n=1 Tax=Paucibacter sp. DJ2R-2 TaxID=2893558 RepID=UPI0021E36FB1|nr:site-specific DNA-methyltransferase [Paucibacter sp. DJ2R-2]MCV2437812.1 site-specific DNA-methyltransferase [Paucibacter sp. DJ2R-2]